MVGQPRRYRVVRVLLVILLCGVAPPLAAFGELDAAFGNGGIVTMPLPGGQGARALALQPDGRIVTAGGSDRNFVLARFEPDGAPDTGFGNAGSGIVQTDISASDSARDIVVQPDGKLIVAGRSAVPDENGAERIDYALVRYNSDGTLDSGFGSGGVATTQFGLDSSATAVALLADERIVVAGFTAAGQRYAVARYTSDGRLDISFGEDGKQVFDLNNRTDFHVALAPQPDGRIIIASGYKPGGAPEDFLVARLRGDGSLDPTFNARGPRPGVVTTDFGGADRALAVAVQHDGRILVAGTSLVDTGDTALVLARYEPDGSLDAGFGNRGRMIVDTGAAYSSPNAIALRPDGGILVAGEVGTEAEQRLYLLRLGPNGERLSADVAAVGESGRARAVAVQPDGKVIVAGSARNAVGGGEELALVRFVNGEAWGLTPEPFVFGVLDDVPRGAMQTSGTVVLNGFEPGMHVPIHVRSGEFARNGSGEFTGAGWAKAGDEITLRHMSAALGQTTLVTVLSAGGVRQGNNLALPIGAESASFTSTTVSGIDRTGSAAISPLALVALLPVAWLLRRRTPRTG